MLDSILLFKMFVISAVVKSIDNWFLSTNGLKNAKLVISLILIIRNCWLHLKNISVTIQILFYLSLCISLLHLLHYICAFMNSYIATKNTIAETHSLSPNFIQAVISCDPCCSIGYFLRWFSSVVSYLKRVWMALTLQSTNSINIEKGMKIWNYLVHVTPACTTFVMDVLTSN